MGAAAEPPKNRLQPNSRRTDSSRKVEKQSASQQHLQPQGTVRLEMVRVRLVLLHIVAYARTRETSCVPKGTRISGAVARDLHSDIQETVSWVGGSTHPLVTLRRCEHRRGLCAFIAAGVRAISAVGPRVVRRGGAPPDVRARHESNNE